MSSFCGGPASGGAQAYADLHPDESTAAEGTLWCCSGAAFNGLAGCFCWEPVWNHEQATPDTSLPVGAAQAAKCHDCAYRPGSPERSDEWLREELYELPEAGARFWCHSGPDGVSEGMRRPVAWRHPLGIEVPGSTADWQPPMVDGTPYRLDGTPALLCAGWAALRLAAMARETQDRP